MKKVKNGAYKKSGYVNSKLLLAQCTGPAETLSHWLLETSDY